MADSIIFETEFIKLELRDGIVFGIYKKGPITLEIAKHAVKCRLEFTNNSPVLMIASEDKLKGMARDARQYLSSDEGMKLLKAAAIVTKSVFASHLANIYLRLSITKPKIPIRLFSNEIEAINWIKKYE